MLRGISVYLPLIFVIGMLVSCSGVADDGITARPSERAISSGVGSHTLWGFYQFTANPDEETLEYVPLRTGELHLNVLPFLEPPPLVYLSLESLEFNGNIIEAGIGLRHPFLGLTEFSGFDVCGIFITNGSYTGFTDTGIRYAGPGDTYLKNPDGLTRWWNPVEFPVNSGDIFGYNDGLLGAPDSYADYNSTLNGYKYFCDDLSDPDATLSEVVPANRGLFSPGQKNVRNYILELGADGLIFNYAIDANWTFPGGDHPWVAPDDFSENANRVEPWHITVTEIENTLYYYEDEGGGELELSIDVYDWFNGELNVLYIQSANGVIPQVGPVSPMGGGEGYSTYEIEITDAYPTTVGDIELLITVETEEADYQDFVPGEMVSAYLLYSTTVGDEPPQQEPDCGVMLPIMSSDHWESTWYQSTNFRSGMTITRFGDPYILGRRRYLDGTWTDAANGLQARKQTNTAEMHDYWIHFDTGVNPVSNLVADSQNDVFFVLNTDPSAVLTISFDPSSGFGSYSTYASLPAGWTIHIMAVDEDDYPVVYCSYSNPPNPTQRRIFHWNGTAWDQVDIPASIYAGGSLHDFAYNPYNGHYVFVCYINDGTGYLITNLQAINQSGNIVHSEIDIFADFNHDQQWRPWMCIDPNDPECHVVIWAGFTPTGFPTVNGYRPIIRYDAAYGGKTIGQSSNDDYDAPWGKGAYCPGTNRLYTGNSIWTTFLTWFELPSDW